MECNAIRHLPEITKDWWEKASYQISWLRDDNENPLQHEGVSTMIDKMLTSCHFKSGNDKIGRWTWKMYRGKRNTLTTIIPTYRPCHSDAEGLVEMQQLRYLREHGEKDNDPHEQYDEDLKEFVERFLDQDHKIIVMGDFNLPISKMRPFLSDNIFCNMFFDTPLLGGPSSTLTKNLFPWPPSSSIHEHPYTHKCISVAHQ